ncbi:hypothetical protein [Acetobacterium wieringae]|uniref:hypothetical protein n=1 Tax=Acetobacterium wieringae TaxID=52694 RepID=UPI0020347B81|nr:hypothetical protein [Acetobacterium wieringae]URN85887.1 hypothetical protein CHL1_001563 [Acetobacterium wieringae]
MIYFRTNKDSNLVELIHYKPFDKNYGLGKTEEELGLEGFLVESIPEPEEIEGKIAVMYYTEADGFIFQYEDIPKTAEQIQAEAIESLRNDLNSAIIELSMAIVGGM